MVKSGEHVPQFFRRAKVAFLIRNFYCHPFFISKQLGNCFQPLNGLHLRLEPIGNGREYGFLAQVIVRFVVHAIQ